MTKQELIYHLETTRETFLDAIINLPIEAYELPGVIGDWTLKDILAHLSRWEAELIKLLWQTQQGKKPSSVHFEPGLDVDRINAQWLQESKQRSLERVLEDFHAVRNQTILRVEGFAEKDLNDPHRYPWLKGTPLCTWIANDSYEHEKEHLQDIQKWLSQHPELTNSTLGGSNAS